MNIEDLAINKLIILYILRDEDFIFSDTKLSSFVLENDLLNYFYLKQYLDEMLNSHLIDIDIDDNYSLTDEGKKSLEIFMDDMDEDLKKKIDDAIFELKRDKFKDESIIAECYQDGEKYFVRIGIIEDVEILDLKLEVPNLEYAKHLCRNFRKNPNEIYQQIVKILD